MGGRGLGWYAERRWEKAVVRYVTPGKGIPVASPHMPDCMGGVFAVFAKIPPPDIATSGVDIFCRNVACCASLLCVPHRLCGSCRGLFTEFTYPCVQVAIREGAARLGLLAPIVQALRQDFCIDTATGWPHSILHRCRPESNHPGWLDGSPRQGDG